MIQNTNTNNNITSQTDMEIINSILNAMAQAYEILINKVQIDFEIFIYFVEILIDDV
jgi:hypothetical protein